MRSHFSRPAFLEGIRDMAPMMLGVIPFGMVCGVGAISAGASPVAALAMSMSTTSMPALYHAEGRIPDGDLHANLAVWRCTP